MNSIRTLALALLFTLGLAVSGHAQFLVQPLKISLSAYDAASHRTLKIGTKELIRHLMGTNVPDAHLDLVTPMGNEPGTIGNLNAFLRIRSGATTVAEISSPDQFNLYQDATTLKTSGEKISTHAINRFSIDNGAVRAELQGISNWSILQRLSQGFDTSGAGSFHSSVNGWIWIYDVTESMAPLRGFIIAGRPHPET